MRKDSQTDEILDAVGSAFSRLRRRVSKVAVDPPFNRKDFSRHLIVEIVHDAEGELTVGALAEELGQDPSVASRAVADCIEAGYIERGVSQQDGRKTVLLLTTKGSELRKQVRSQHRQAFEILTHDWTEQERLDFVRLLLKYTNASAGSHT